MLLTACAGAANAFGMEAHGVDGVGCTNVRAFMLAVPSSQRVLIVDDDEVSRRVTALMFQARGWSVETAQDLRTAIDMAIRQQPNVIVTELLLPDVHGLQFVRALRSTVEHDIQIVALTRAAVSVLEQARKEGFDLAFAKPLDIDDIDGHVRKTTRMSALGREG